MITNLIATLIIDIFLNALCGLSPDDYCLSPTYEPVFHKSTFLKDTEGS